jgi:NAD(P)-dependent dehydrogenase (short-subunit alcohol dehydrogenase family)
VLQAIPLGRYGKVEEIAGAVAFLAGPDASYITARRSTSTAARRHKSSDRPSGGGATDASAGMIRKLCPDTRQPVGTAAG